MKISLSNICNSKCPYCFAGTMGIDKNSFIKLEDFEKVLDFALANNDRHIILLGGEPTLHPEFKRIIEMIDEKFCGNYSLSLLTNGSKLYEYLDILPEETSFLINVNSPETLGKNNFENMIKSFDYMKALNMFDKKYTRQNLFDNITYSKVTLGCNVCYEINDYSFFWNIVDKYKATGLRMSIASPQNNEFLYDRESYYKIMKPKMMDFVENLIKRNLFVNYDCSKIPPCFFNQDEIIMIFDRANYKMEAFEGCSDMYQVLPNLNVSCCFGDKDFEKAKKPLSEFANINQVKEHVKKIRDEANNSNWLKKCNDCKLSHLGLCRGGCFGFTDGNKLNN